MKRILLLGALLFGAPLSASAFPQGSTANNDINSQNNSGTVIQNPSGGHQTNVNQNNAYNSTYGFGIGINCPTPSLALSTFGSGFHDGISSTGASVSVIVPIGGRVGTACRDLAEEITKQRKLDTAINVVRMCAAFKKEGISVDTEAFPELKDCDGVMVTKLTK